MSVSQRHFADAFARRTPRRGLALALLLLMFCAAGGGGFAARATATPLTITAVCCESGSVGQFYGGALEVSGGTPPYTWSMTPETPTDGLTFSNGSGPAVKVYGTPPYAGTVNFRATVTDSSNPPEESSKSETVTILPAQAPPAWDLRLNGQVPSTSSNTGTVVANPHVAFVLVGSWWCSLFANPGFAPKLCRGHAKTGAPVEQSQFVSTLDHLITDDYSSSYDANLAHFYEVSGCGLFGIGCTTTFVGPGVALRNYSPYGGAIWAGPLAAKEADQKSIDGSLANLAPGFSVSSASSIRNTVFVLLFAPEELSCKKGNPSTNSQTSGHGFIYASVYLEDASRHCKGDFGGPPNIVTPYQFGTWATSHELDEAITSPGSNPSSWVVLAPPAQGWQIADPCVRRNADGETTYKEFPFDNFTRDSLGTVVAAYVDPDNPAFCSPSASSGIPPG
jgi:hypothetical protein